MSDKIEIRIDTGPIEFKAYPGVAAADIKILAVGVPGTPGAPGSDATADAAIAAEAALREAGDGRCNITATTR